jgi:hypothetical protein
VGRCRPHPDPNTGKRKKVQRTVKLEREAKRWVNEQQGAVNNGTAVVPSNMTVSELMAYWLEHYIRHQKSPKTFVS